MNLAAGASPAVGASPADEYGALRTGVGGRVVSRDMVRVGGPDAASYLQGQCSQDVQALAAGQTADSLLLEPQGKLDALVRVTRDYDGDGFVLDVDGGWGPVVIARLERFKLRVKVEIAPLEWQCLSLRGPEATQAAAGVGAPLSLPFSWGGAVGVDLLGPSLSMPPGIRPCGAESWEALRVEAGIPVMGTELDERTIAAEAGLVERCVSLTKGCYTGQELVARLDARGSKVARRLVGLVVGPDENGDLGVPPGVTEIAEEAGGRVVGAVTSSARSPVLGLVALGYLHRRVTTPATVVLVVPNRPTVVAEARPLPLVS
jgi:tRNA-modifying protein YgfZ